jgi:ATP:ADP antiporter, AAA family
MTRLRERVVGKIVSLQEGEAVTAVMMFAYSFLTMTAYNILKPITRSKFITALGADNLPYVLLAAGALIGVLMQQYSRAVGRLPRSWVIPVTQAGEVALLVLFWVLFRTGADWVSVAFYVLALILGILLISQFWTLANDIYDPRQAKRLFGFIGGGASLGGAVGAGITSVAVADIGTNNLLLVSAAILAICVVLVTAIVRREGVKSDFSAVGEERGVGGGEAIRMLRSSPHLQTIALVIGFAAIGAAIIEQQLNMAAASMKDSSPDAITAFLAQITFYLSAAGFLIQVGLTSRIHRSLGLMFALLILPVSLGSTATLILLNGALWTAGAARVLDTSFRYTIDKTTREVLFLPLPVDLKYRAKPFVDVTVDRAAKALGALLCLVLIKPWGLHFDWRHLSYASLVVTGLWILLAMRARREYLKAFRRSIETRAMLPAGVRMNVADAATVETLVEELSHPDEARVLYAIDMLETLDRRNLITPLLLHHDSARVRARTLATLESARPAVAERWLPSVGRLLSDEDPNVRAAAVHALAALRKEEVSTLMRRYLRDPEPRIAVTAAVVLADSGGESDAHAAEAALTRLIEDTRKTAAVARREVAAALGQVRNPGFRPLLVPLIHDSDLDVALTAIRSARMAGPSDMLFVPALVTLLGHRVLKPAAREVLVSYGNEVLDALAYFMKDRDENLWVRRHIPATLALIPTQQSMNVLLEGLNDPDGFLRYKVITAIERLRRDHPELVFERHVMEGLLLKESARYYNHLTLRFNLLQHDADAPRSLIVRALDDKLERALDRIYRLLGLVYPWKDVAAARYTLAHGDPRARASALEYLDNLLGGAIRKRIMPILEDTPMDEKVRRANAILRTRPRDLEDTLAQLVHEHDEGLAAAAIHFVAHRRLWTLADDLEYVLAHRPGDRYVVEAASWALAAHRLSRPGTGLPADPLPAVELVDRLRGIRLFDFVSVDEMFRIAGTGRQLIHSGGRELYDEGGHPDEVQFLLEGSVRLARADGQPTRLDAPASLAFEEMLEGSAVRHRITAVDRAVCLAFGGDQFLTMLSDNIVLAQGLFRVLLETPAVQRWRTVHAPRPGVELIAPRGDTMQPIEKVILLKQSPALARATMNQLLDVAGIMRETPLVRDAVLFTETDAPAIYYVLSGGVRLEADGTEAIDAGQGATIGLPETLAGVSLGRRAVVTREGQALRVDREDLFDVLADNIDLLQGLFAGLLRPSPVEHEVRDRGGSQPTSPPAEVSRAHPRATSSRPED